MFTILDKASYWDEKYLNNQITWDLKGHNPVFEEIIKKAEFILPGKILITGCGKGYDAVLAAKYGFEVTAIDFSPRAIEFACELAKKKEVKVNFIAKDIFLLEDDYFQKFDYVYEYVTYCAINPDRRKEYLSKISTLIKPSGKLIAHLFPIDDRVGGPPFSLNATDFYKMASEYFKLVLSTKKINSIKPRAGKEILQIYLKPTVHI